MKKIKLTHGQYALIDDEDFEKISSYSWYATKGRRKEFYARAYSRNGLNDRRINIYMHRLIMNFPEKQVDHINHNTLDNRKENLRIATATQNSMNKSVIKNKWGYKGVYYYNSYKKKTDRLSKAKHWVARIKLEKKTIYLGFHNTVEEAAKAYNKAAKKYFGNFAYLNKV